MFRRARHRAIGLSCTSRMVAESRSRGSRLRSRSREDGITSSNSCWLRVLAIAAYVVTPVFLQAINASGYANDALMNQQRMAVITTMLTNDLLKAELVIPDSDDPEGASDRLDFAVSEVIAEGGSLVNVRSN